MWELDHKEGWVPKNWCFQTVVLEKTLESPLNSKEIQPFHPKENQPWIFVGRTDIEAATPILWPPDAKNWLVGKDPDAGKDWGQEEKGTTEDERVGWHHWLNGHDFEQTRGDSEGQGGLVCCIHGVTNSQTWLDDWTTITAPEDRWAAFWIKRRSWALWDKVASQNYLLRYWDLSNSKLIRCDCSSPAGLNVKTYVSLWADLPDCVRAFNIMGLDCELWWTQEGGPSAVSHTKKSGAPVSADVWLDLACSGGYQRLEGSEIAWGGGAGHASGPQVSQRLDLGSVGAEAPWSVVFLMLEY